MRCASLYRKGLMRTPYMTLKMAQEAPIPRPREMTMMRVAFGWARRLRTAKRRPPKVVELMDAGIPGYGTKDVNGAT